MKVFTIVHGSFLFLHITRCGGRPTGRPYQWLGHPRHVGARTWRARPDFVCYEPRAMKSRTNIHILYYHPLLGYGTERP